MTIILKQYFSHIADGTGPKEIYQKYQWGIYENDETGMKLANHDAVTITYIKL